MPGPGTSRRILNNFLTRRFGRLWVFGRGEADRDGIRVQHTRWRWRAQSRRSWTDYPLALAITAGRISDRIGRKIMTFAVVCCAGGGFALFYSGLSGWWLPPLWVLSFFGFFSGEAMIAGFALEIVPTHYRATVSGLRYLVYVGTGAVSLALEGRLYDHFHAHGPAIQLLLATIPITLVAILFLPEPAGKTLEEISGGTAP